MPNSVKAKLKISRFDESLGSGWVDGTKPVVKAGAFVSLVKDGVGVGTGEGPGVGAGVAATRGTE